MKNLITLFVVLVGIYSSTAEAKTGCNLKLTSQVSTWKWSRFDHEQFLTELKRALVSRGFVLEYDANAWIDSELVISFSTAGGTAYKDKESVYNDVKFKVEAENFNRSYGSDYRSWIIFEKNKKSMTDKKILKTFRVMYNDILSIYSGCTVKN